MSESILTSLINFLKIQCVIIFKIHNDTFIKFIEDVRITEIDLNPLKDMYRYASFIESYKIYI